MSARGFVIAAPRSGSGKTTLTLGLMRALRRRGLQVCGLKCGPDYIDPAFHAVATGRQSFNLDSWAMPPDLTRALATQAADGAHLAICEGLMGLFDGVPAATGRSGSTADVAAAFGWPVILVLDVSGQSQSAGALALGCASFDPRVQIGGVVLNRVGSERHRNLAARAVEQAGLHVLGALPRAGEITLPERHLGLVQASETTGLDAALEKLADFVEMHADLDKIFWQSPGHSRRLIRLTASLSRRRGSASPSHATRRFHSFTRISLPPGARRARKSRFSRRSMTKHRRKPAMSAGSPAAIRSFTPSVSRMRRIFCPAFGASPRHGQCMASAVAIWFWAARSSTPTA